MTKKVTIDVSALTDSQIKTIENLIEAFGETIKEDKPESVTVGSILSLPGSKFYTYKHGTAEGFGYTDHIHSPCREFAEQMLADYKLQALIYWANDGEVVKHNGYNFYHSPVYEVGSKRVTIDSTRYYTCNKYLLTDKGLEKFKSIQGWEEVVKAYYGIK